MSCHAIFIPTGPVRLTETQSEMEKATTTTKKIYNKLQTKLHFVTTNDKRATKKRYKCCFFKGHNLTFEQFLLCKQNNAKNALGHSTNRKKKKKEQQPGKRTVVMRPRRIHFISIENI